MITNVLVQAPFGKNGETFNVYCNYAVITLTTQENYLAHGTILFCFYSEVPNILFNIVFESMDKTEI
jgi:hypothetical protein